MAWSAKPRTSSGFLTSISIDIDVRNPELVRGFADQAMDRLNLLLPRIADTDAKHRQACMDSFQPCHQSGLGSGASGGMNQTVENQ